MNIQDELWQDYLALAEKYGDLMPSYEFGYTLIRFSVKMLMDTAPRHGVALETIKVATEDGIKWHVNDKHKGDK